MFLFILSRSPIGHQSNGPFSMTLGRSELTYPKVMSWCTEISMLGAKDSPRLSVIVNIVTTFR